MRPQRSCDTVGHSFRRGFTHSRAGNGRGFTLLEVLVAISILGLGLTVILSSQVGLFASTGTAQNLTLATNLARCKMNEAELDLLEEGYPLVDRDDEGRCCDESDDRRFRCEWRVERIELPQPAGITMGDGGIDDPTASTEDTSSLGPLGALAEIQQSGGANLGENPDLGSLAQTLSGGEAAAGVQGMIPMLMGMVYPNLKPMLEASIRKVTVVVKWKEGRHERDFSLTQYVTNPQQGGLNGQVSDAVNQAAQQFGVGQPGMGSSSSGQNPSNPASRSPGGRR